MDTSIMDGSINSRIANIADAHDGKFQKITRRIIRLLRITV